jgi:uncharacterized protein YdaT
MPWTETEYPDAMKNLTPEIRLKAIEIANALLEEKNLDEGIAIATGISRAKDWATKGGKKDEKTDKKNNDSDKKKEKKADTGKMKDKSK